MRSRRSPPILVKNHPHEPVLRITGSFSFKASLALIDVRVLDHLIVGGRDVCSLAELGKM